MRRPRKELTSSDFEVLSTFCISFLIVSFISLSTFFSIKSALQLLECGASHMVRCVKAARGSWRSHLPKHKTDLLTHGMWPRK